MLALLWVLFLSLSLCLFLFWSLLLSLAFIFKIQCSNVRTFIDKCVLYCVIVKFLDSCYSIFLYIFFSHFMCWYFIYVFFWIFIFMFLFVTIWIPIQQNRQFIRLLNVAAVIVFFSPSSAVCNPIKCEFSKLYNIVGSCFSVCTVCCNLKLLHCFCFFEIRSRTIGYFYCV